MLWIVFAVIVVSHADAISKDDCPNSIPRDKWTEVRGEACYRFELDIKKEYEDAQYYCQRRGGNLVIIKSRELNDFITDKLKNKFGYTDDAWIGLNDIDDEGEFFWVDGNPMQFSNFADGNGPDGGFLHFFRHGIEDCVAIHGSDGKWHDYKCSDYFLGIVKQHKRFICEFQVDIPETTPAPTTTTTFKTTTTTAVPTTTTACPDMDCELDCGMDGFKSDGNDCPICQCDSYDAATPSITINQRETAAAIPTDAKSNSISSTSTTVSTTTSTSVPVTSKTTEGSQKTTCSSLICDLDCGLLGYTKGPNGCMVCECGVL